MSPKRDLWENVKVGGLLFWVEGVWTVIDAPEFEGTVVAGGNETGLVAEGGGCVAGYQGADRE